jgi:hypothetical protein
MYSDCWADIKFSGNLEGGFKSFFELELENLMEEAPSDASISSYFKKMKDGYTGIVNIVSSQGRFVAEAASQDLNEIVASIKEQIHRQIAEWREARVFTETEDLAAIETKSPGFAQRAVQAFNSLRKGNLHA